MTPHSTTSPWLRWLTAQLGTSRWVVATRLTPRLKAKGYTVALTPKRWAALEAAYAAETGLKPW